MRSRNGASGITVSRFGSVVVGSYYLIQHDNMQHVIDLLLIGVSGGRNSGCRSGIASCSLSVWLWALASLIVLRRRIHIASPVRVPMPYPFGIRSRRLTSQQRDRVVRLQAKPMKASVHREHIQCHNEVQGLFSPLGV
jgi:hypothetical protein